MRPYALSMAGFDPSGGAGLLADCKTMEALGVYGLGVCTALTVQNDVAFERIIGVGAPDVRDQAQVLLQRFPVEWAKLGLVDNLPELPGLLSWLRELRPTLSLVWDPVLKASAGYDFHTAPPPQLVAQLCRQLALLTPNRPEVLRLWPAATPELAAAAVSVFCPVLLKGGHAEGAEATDLLFSDGQEIARFTTPRLPHGAKHGSGCVLSAAITAELAKGQPLLEACQRGKDYTTRVLASNDTLLGYHFQDH